MTHLPISLPEYRDDSAALAQAEDANRREQANAAVERREAKQELALARLRGWRAADGKTRDVRLAQVEVTVADEKDRVLAAEDRLDQAKQHGFTLGHRSQRLVMDARFSVRQMELDTPAPNRARHWERTS